MAGRMRPSLIPKLVLPGPGYYDGEYTVTKSKPPVYSMRGKFNVITDNNKPGPGAHCPEKVSQITTDLYMYVHISINIDMTWPLVLGETFDAFNILWHCTFEVLRTTDPMSSARSLC